MNKNLLMDDDSDKSDNFADASSSWDVSDAPTGEKSWADKVYFGNNVDHGKYNIQTHLVTYELQTQLVDTDIFTFSTEEHVLRCILFCNYEIKVVINYKDYSKIKFNVGKKDYVKIPYVNNCFSIDKYKVKKWIYIYPSMYAKADCIINFTCYKCLRKSCIKVTKKHE